MLFTPSQAPSHPTYAPSANTRDPTYAPSITSTTLAPTYVYGSSDQPTYNPSVSPILHTTTTSPTATVPSNPSWSPNLRPILTTDGTHSTVSIDGHSFQSTVHLIGTKVMQQGNTLLVVMIAIVSFLAVLTICGVICLYRKGVLNSIQCCNSRVQKGVEWMQSISQNNIIRDHVEDSKVQKRKVKGLQITDEGVPGIHDRAEDAIHDIAIDGVGSELENKVPQGERREGSTVEKGDEYATKGTNDDDCIGNDEFVIKGDDEVNFTRTNK